MTEYTSNHLCHFVGRSLTNDEARFELLMKIVESGKLIANLDDPDKPQLFLSGKHSCETIGEIFEKTDCVCFCDIPDRSLSLHTSKYSKFGIGFNKTLLASKGAHPVLYIPVNHEIKEKSQTTTPKKPAVYFLTVLKENIGLISFLSLINQVNPFEKQVKAAIKLLPPEILKVFDQNVLKRMKNGQSHQMMCAQTTALTGLMSYIKLFDESLDINDEKNYYMEREWRILNNVEFSIEDVLKVYLPNKEYTSKFKEKFPNYNGEFYYLNKSGA